MIRLSSNRPLIFETAGRGISRQGWLLLTLASWGFFLSLIVPAVSDLVIAAAENLRGPDALFALLNDVLFAALLSYGKLTGGTLALALGVTSLDRLVRYKPPTIAIVDNTVAEPPPIVITRVSDDSQLPAPAQIEAFDGAAIAAMQSSQRLLAHHDEHGKLVAVTLLAKGASTRAIADDRQPG